MVSWTNNENWDVSLQRDYCGYVSDRFTPCQHRRPCPIHEPAEDAPASPHPSDQAGASGSPLPRLMEEM
jgi:hypothetical protein